MTYSLAASAQDTVESSHLNTANLIIIDKLTAKKHTLKVKSGHSTTFEKLNINVRKCWIDEPPKAEHAVLIDIMQNSSNANNAMVYTGWLFKNKSDITNVEHRLYDVALASCDAATTPAS